MTMAAPTGWIDYRGPPPVFPFLIFQEYYFEIRITVCVCKLGRLRPC
jgi:hypothetical protein